MIDNIRSQLRADLDEITSQGLKKNERAISSPQGVNITVNDRQVINFCANNYLGLSDHPNVVQFAKESLDQWGYGLSSVRFICGTQTIHVQLEAAVAKFLGVDDCILYSSCFDANGGLFETLTGEQDVIISDRLNHASIIDGIRLSKAERLLYQHLDMGDLEIQLRSTAGKRRKFIVTDGVYSMDGDIAPLDAICRLAEQYDAQVIVDDSHAVGFMGNTGAGTPEHFHVTNKIDLITGTFGKALGGSSGGFIAGRQEMIDLLRQRSRPYLFSNSLAPHITATTIKVLDYLKQHSELRRQLWDNTKYFREKISSLGLDVRPGVHPIVPVMLYDAVLAQKMSDRLLKNGVYVMGFFYPVVPKGQARIRVQISAAHTRQHLDTAIHSFQQAARDLGIIPD